MVDKNNPEEKPFSFEDDIFFFDEEESMPDKTGDVSPWKILVVDDEDDVHTATHLIVDPLKFQGKRVKVLDAYSSLDARKILLENPDIAVILLDVVMETVDSGLNLVQFIREECNNPFARIVLRTGQPGYAPERNVIVDYDINDYRLKTELTSDKMFTLIISSLRSYEYLMVIESYRIDLEGRVSERTQELNSKKDELQDLLDKTLKGSVRVLVDILSAVRPLAFSQAQSMRRLASKVAHRMNFENIWEIEVASLLSQVGVISIPDDVIEKRFSGKTMSPGDMRIFASHAKTGESIVRRIPKLANISEAIGKQFLRFEDCDCSNTQITQIANVLKVINDYTYLEAIGMNVDAAIESMQRKYGSYDRDILDALKSELKGIEEGFILKSVRLADLELESIIAEDIKSEKNVLLIRKGSEVTKVLKIILKNFSVRSKIKEPIKVLVRQF